METWRFPLLLIFAVEVFLLSTSIAVPLPIKCPLGENLNSLIGKEAIDKAAYVAEEEAVGFTNGAENATLPGVLNEEQLKECFKETPKGVANKPKPPLPPGVTAEDDPSKQPLLPYKEGREEDIGVKGEYFTTYDSRKYNFKKKGFVIDAPTSPTTTESPKKEENKNELISWYDALVDVVADYV